MKYEKNRVSKVLALHFISIINLRNQIAKAGMEKGPLPLAFDGVITIVKSSFIQRSYIFRRQQENGNP